MWGQETKKLTFPFSWKDLKHETTYWIISENVNDIKSVEVKMVLQVYTNVRWEIRQIIAGVGDQKIHHKFEKSLKG